MKRLATGAIAVAIGFVLVRADGLLALAGKSVLAVLAVGLIVAALVGRFILELVRGSIETNLPQQIRWRLAAEPDFPEEAQHQLARFRGLGFQPIDGVREVELSPPALFVPMFSERERAYASVIVAGGTKIAVDVISMLDAGGSLTTASNVDAGVLPASPGLFCQIVPDGDPTDLIPLHRQAVAALAEMDVTVRAVSAETFDADFQAAFSRRRRAFQKSPWRFAVTALWRTIRKHNPHTTPLVEQRDAMRLARRVGKRLQRKATAAETSLRVSV